MPPTKEPPLSRHLAHLCAASSFSELFEAVANAFVEATGADRALVWSYPALLGKERLALVKLRILHSTESDYSYERQVDDAWTGEVAASLPPGFRSIVTHEALDDLPDDFLPDASSFVLLPLPVPVPAAFLASDDASGPRNLQEDAQEMALAVVYLERRQANADFNLNDPAVEQLLLASQRQTLLHWDRWRLTEQVSGYEKAVNRVEILLQTSQAIAKGVVLNDFLAYLLDQVISATRAQRGFVAFLEKGDEIRIAAGRSKRGHDLLDEEAEISMSTLRECLDERKPVYVVNAQEDQRYAAKSSIITLDLQTILCTPLIVEEQVIGAMYLDSKYISDTLAQDDLRLLESLAGTASVAINNNRLVLERIEREALNRENENLRSLDRRKTELLRTVAHELRNPLSVIVGYTEMLQKRGASNEDVFRNALSRIHENGGKISEMLEGLLDISRLKSGMYKVERKPVLIAEALQEAMDDCGVLCERKGIALKSESPPNVMVLADPGLLHQVLMNLLTNAVKYSRPEGEVWCRVASFTTRDESSPSDLQAKMSVTDQGIGIPEDELERVFEVFHRVGHGETDWTEGTGLGLAISKTIVETLGGSIGVKSQLGRGSTFWFTLPAL